MVVNKALILAAGFGTRMQSLTNGGSKEMLLLKDKPIIYYSIIEALNAGCSSIGIVINPLKKDLHNYLLEQKKQGLPITIILKDSKGMVNSMLAGKEFVGDEAFSMILPDMLYAREPNALKQLIEVYEKFGSPVVGLFKDAPTVGKGWYAQLSDLDKENIFLIASIKDSGSIRFFGRYVFNKEVFSYLNLFSLEESEKRLLDLLILKHKLYGVFFEDSLFDTGTPDGFFHAQKLFI